MRLMSKAQNNQPYSTANLLYPILSLRQMCRFFG